MRSTGSAISLTLRFVAAAVLFAFGLYLAVKAATGWYRAFNAAEGGSGTAAILYTLAAVFVGGLTLRLLKWDPARRSPPVPSPAQRTNEVIDKVRELAETPLPEPVDVPLPASAGTIESTADGLHIEFPQAQSVIGGGSSILLAVIFGAVMAGESTTTAGIVILLPLAAVFVAWPLYASLRGRYRRCCLDASVGGLVTCRGWGDKLRCREIPRGEIDLLEPRLVVMHGTESFFEIAAVLRDGERVVLGENIPGLAVADTLVRRIGTALGLHPEQVFTTAGSARRQLAPLLGILGPTRS